MTRNSNDRNSSISVIILYYKISACAALLFPTQCGGTAEVGVEDPRQEVETIRLYGGSTF